MATYIDLSLSSGGSGTLINPYGAVDGVNALSALSGDQGGESFLFKAGSFGRIHKKINFVAGVKNLTLGYYGTGAKPIICGSKLVTGSFTLHSGNVWKISWTEDQTPSEVARDTFFYGDSELEFGKRLTFCPTLADCEATSYSQYYDDVNDVMYINLDGLNPNNYVIEATHDHAEHNIHFQAGDHSNLEIDGIRSVNARDCCCFIDFDDDRSGLTIRDYTSEQGGALQNSTQWVDRGGMQIVGAETHGHYLTDVLIERYESFNHLHAGLTLLFMKDAIIHDVYMNGCGGTNLGFWNDMVGTEVSKVKIHNVIPQKFWESGDWSSGETTQRDYHAIYAPWTGVAANGYSWNNRVSGFEFVNCRKHAINICAGHGWVFENGTIYQTAQHAPSSSGSAVNFERRGSSQSDYVEATFSNNLVIYDTDGGQAFLDMENLMTDTHVHGDNNYYVNVGGGTPVWRTAPQYTSFATYQADADVVAAGLDQNSTYTTTNPVRDLGTLSNDSNPLGSDYAISAYITGVDLTPKNAIDDASDSAVLSAGSAIWKTANTAPTLGALGVAASGAQGARTYYVAASWVGEFGETQISAESSQAVGANEVLTVAAPGSPPSWAIGWNVYASETSGALKMQNNLPIGTATNWQEPDTGLQTGDTVKDPFDRNFNPTAPSDVTGEPFAPASPTVGGIQYRNATHPARFSRASGGW